ncbi:MAG: serine hydrolase [Methylibium sp.]|uniref:serine hydrolase n=1 Tax=Methylibium sp. TaxID=2067992 RepID=UPI001827A7D8|nr:serine hydrolase [Methylibium sp.]MBA3598329.1 serine hydrolase [Methylibium sp.]
MRPLKLVATLLAVLVLTTGWARASPASAWAERLEAELAWVEAKFPGEMGVYVRDLGTGTSASHRAQENWYLASMIKVPVAIAVLRGIERGDYTLETPLTVRASDYVDGAGQTNWHAIGSRLSISYLLDQMIIHSDNTASDMLIGLVGISEVNALVQSLVPQGLGPITSLVDVRRHAYSQLAPAAMQLPGLDFLLLRNQRTDAERLAVFSRLVGTPIERLHLPTLRDAYDAYYATELNSGRLDAYGELLALLAEGKTLAPASTAYLLDVLERVETGTRRIKAGLPASVRFAHKTGTQRARVCDAGVITVAGADRRIVVVACVRGEPSVARSERALEAVGEAISKSGLISDENTP